MDAATGSQHEAHDDTGGGHVTAASSNIQTNPSPQGHTAESGNSILNDELQHHLPPPAAETNPEVEQHEADSASDRNPSGNTHIIINDDDDHSQPTSAVFSNTSPGLHSTVDTTHAAASGSSQDASLIFSQTPAAHQMPSGLASRLSHRGHVQGSTIKPGSIAKQDIVARQLSQEELKLLLNM